MSEPPALSGPAPKPGQYVKISLYLKKLPHISDDYFHAYWANNHLVPAFANKKFMDKVRRYNQHHVPSEWRDATKLFGLPVMEYDGIAEVWVDSLDDWKEIVSDPEFVKEVASKPLFFYIGVTVPDVEAVYEMAVASGAKKIGETVPAWE